jgi:hypothetical protein
MNGDGDGLDSERFLLDQINYDNTTVYEQLIEFIMREILDPKGEFYHNGPINRVASASTS